MSTNRENALRAYIVLLDLFASRRVTFEEFNRVYSALFLRDSNLGVMYPVLNDIFTAADCYYEVADPANPFQIDETELRNICATALSFLRELDQRRSGTGPDGDRH